jgi:two-component system, LytTR family, sensor kinase
VLRRIAWKQLLLPLGLWSLLVLFFSTRTEVRGEPFVWMPITWGEALAISLAQWSAWGALALVIIWIDRRLPIERDALFRRFLFHVPLSLVFTVAYAYLNYGNLTLLDAPRDASLLAGGVLATSWRMIHRNGTFFYWVIVGTYIAVDYQNHLKNRLVRTAELERLLSEARLNVLRTQLQPHFLFNALNAISAHVESEPRTARLMLERLGDLLRLSLDHIDHHEIGLDQELAFVERYLQLQAMRFEDRLHVSMNLAPEVQDALVPPFILQPLVENAIQHGTAARSANGTIAVEAWRDNGRVRLVVRDNGPGLPTEWSMDRNQGIGIANTRERLRHLYGEQNQSLKISQEPGGGVRVDLSLPFHSTSEPEGSGSHSHDHR